METHRPRLRTTSKGGHRLFGIVRNGTLLAKIPLMCPLPYLDRNHHRLVFSSDKRISSYYGPTRYDR